MFEMSSKFQGRANIIFQGRANIISTAITHHLIAKMLQQKMALRVTHVTALHKTYSFPPRKHTNGMWFRVGFLQKCILLRSFTV